MVARGHRRQVLLFLVAIILPCVVLVALGLRMVAQERELADKRRADERHALAGQVRHDLATRLDLIALQETAALSAEPGLAGRAYLHPAVALVAPVAHGRLVLPWERDPRPARFQRSISRPPFAQLMMRGERAEIGGHRPAAAAGVYTEALASAADAAQTCYARLLRARALLAADRRDAAVPELAVVVRSCLDVVDEHGVPLGLYAASRLQQVGVRRETVAASLHRTAGDSAWLSPTALYLLRSLTDSIRTGSGSRAQPDDSALAGAVAARLARSERAIALQRAFPQLGLGGAPGPRTDEPRWVAYGSPAWLVGRVTDTDGRDVVIAVEADALFAETAAAVLGSAAATAALVAGAGDEADVEPLGSAFPALAVRLGGPAATAGPGTEVRRWFYLVTLLLVVSVTLFGAYFLSRDVRRELRVAELRSRFVSAVSHELKTPLTAIRMYAETLQLGRSTDAATRAEYLETIVNESERLTRLLNNVLDYSKIERGGRPYRRAPNDLADIVSASARAMKYPLEQQRFTLRVAVEDGLPPAAVDRDAIEQAILNLLANAMKYSGDSREIDLRLARADGQALIEVTDRGVGIAPDQQARIFEQFYRVPGDNDGIPGTGLGLTLVRHIAEGHGGRVTVRSVPGQGSTFTIHVPLGGVA